MWFFSQDYNKSSPHSCMRWLIHTHDTSPKTKIKASWSCIISISSFQIALPRANITFHTLGQPTYPKFNTDVFNYYESSTFNPRLNRFKHLKTLSARSCHWKCFCFITELLEDRHCCKTKRCREFKRICISMILGLQNFIHQKRS